MRRGKGQFIRGNGRKNLAGEGVNCEKDFFSKKVQEGVPN